jgi:hypothetical protein
MAEETKGSTVKKANWGKLGGTHAMHGARGTAEQKPGVSSQEGSGPLNSNQKVQAGPSGAGFYSSATTNKDYAGQQTPGVSAATKSGGDDRWAKGGSGSTLGNRGSQPARGGHSAPS